MLILVTRGQCENTKSRKYSSVFETTGVEFVAISLEQRISAALGLGLLFIPPPHLSLRHDLASFTLVLEKRTLIVLLSKVKQRTFSRPCLCLYNKGAFVDGIFVYQIWSTNQSLLSFPGSSLIPSGLPPCFCFRWHHHFGETFARQISEEVSGGPPRRCEPEPGCQRSVVMPTPASGWDVC